jgi:hypothetical protein
MSTAETGCCPRFDPGPWDEEEFQFEDRLFLRARTVNFLHIPLNIGSMFKKTWATIQAADAVADEFLVLSTDPSPWRGEHYFAVTKDIPGADMVRLSGHYLTKVYEGPYRNARIWVRDMQQRVEAAGKQLGRLYFFYTTCPKCAKHYGKNYVVGFAEI